MFVSYRGGLLNSDEISRVERTPKAGTALHMKDGSTHYSDEDYDELCRRLGPVIPETGGAHSVHMGYFQGEFYYYTQPILGWTISPVGPEAIISGGDEVTCILFADGTVERPHDSRFDTLSAAIEDWKRLNPPKDR